MHPVRDIRVALALLTSMPLARGSDPAPRPDLVAWFPWVGHVIGAVGLALLMGAHTASVVGGDGGWLGRAAYPLAGAVIALWALLARFMHWDGLADVADAWWGGSTPQQRLEIMSDTRVGAFGVTAVVLAAIGGVTGLATLIGTLGLGMAVFAVPVFGRTAIVFSAWLGRPAKPDGLGSLVIGKPSLAAIVIAIAGVAVACAAVIVEHGTIGALWCAGALVLSAGIPHVIALRMGGVTGDVMGASVVLSETAALVLGALMVTF